MTKLSIMQIFKNYWWLIFIPLIPVALNFFLPMGHWSRIGGEDSPILWLSFWASFSNSLIYCFVTFWVLYRQIKSDSNQNDLNRASNKKENILNRNDNAEQNNLNREITLSTIKYNTQLSQLSNLIPICAEYIALFDLTEIKYLERAWRDHVYSKEYYQKYLKDWINNAKKVSYRFILYLQASDSVDTSFIDRQKNHIARLFNMLSIIRKYFSVEVADFSTPDGLSKIIKLLNKNDLDIIFNEESDFFWQIEYEFSELGLNSIQLEFEIFILNQKEQISRIINGKTENEDT